VNHCDVPAFLSQSVVAKLKEIRSRLKISSSVLHTLSAPMLSGVLPHLFTKDLSPQEQAIIDRHIQQLITSLVRGAASATKRGSLRFQEICPLEASIPADSQDGR